MTSIDMLSQLEAVDFTTAQARLLIKINEDQKSVLATKKDVNFLSGQIENLEDKIENVRGEFKNMDVKIENVEDKIENVRGEIENVRGEIENVRGEIENVRNDLKSEIKNVRGEIENVRGEIENVRGELNTVQADIKDIKQKLGGMAKAEALLKMEDSFKLLVESSINKAKYDVAKWIVGAVVANGLIATLLSVFT